MYNILRCKKKQTVAQDLDDHSYFFCFFFLVAHVSQNQSPMHATWNHCCPLHEGVEEQPIHPPASSLALVLPQ